MRVSIEVLCEDYTVLEFDDKTCTIEEVVTKKQIKIPLYNVTKMFRSGMACTVHSCQGKSINVPYAIVGWSGMKNTCKYVSLSRATDKKLVTLID